MLAVAYGSLGVVGFLIYRGIKKNQAHQQAQEENRTPDA
jgi:hypothetical protein